MNIHFKPIKLLSLSVCQRTKKCPILFFSIYNIFFFFLVSMHKRMGKRFEIVVSIYNQLSYILKIDWSQN